MSIWINLLFFVYAVFFTAMMVYAFLSDREHQRHFKAHWGMPEANQAWELIRRLRQFQPGEQVLAEWGLKESSQFCALTIRCDGEYWEVGYHLFDDILICEARSKRLLDALKAVEKIVWTDGQGRLIT